MRQSFEFRCLSWFCALLLVLGEVQFWGSSLSAATAGPPRAQESRPDSQSAGHKGAQFTPSLETSQDWNRRLTQLLDPNLATPSVSAQEDRIGSEDVLDVSIFAAAELNREVRVSANGEISLPLLGGIRAAGLTPPELERVLEELLRSKYINDPHVSVFVRDMQSHPVSVIGAVRKPGVFQIRGSKTLLEVLSLAEGMADDAGETVLIMRGARVQNVPEPFMAKSAAFTEPLPATPHSGETVEPGLGFDLKKEGLPPEGSVRVNLKELLESADLSHNPLVYPGDIVKVTRAGIVYVIGSVGRPGGFAMKTNESMSILQAMALSGGLTRTAAKSGVRIVHNDEHGVRTETPIDVGKVMSGKVPDPMLTSGDIVFVPDSAAKIVFSRGVEGAAQTLTGLLIFHW